MESGLATVVKELRTDPYALETVYVSAIAFAGIAKAISPLVELSTFYPPKLPLGGGTSLSAALSCLMNEIDHGVRRSTSEQKGDWRPVVYLFTDGHPTDNFDSVITRWQKDYAAWTTVIAVGFGKAADYETLRQLSAHVVKFEESKDGDFKKFVSWITASVAAQSKSVGEGQDAVGLPELDESVMHIVKEPNNQTFDETCVTFVGRCQGTGKPYLIKYERTIDTLATKDFQLNVPSFVIAGCYPLSEDYFQWTGESGNVATVNTQELIGAPGCPYCGAMSAFALCQCGKLLCTNGPGHATCPWCREKFELGKSGDEDGFDIGRGRG